MSQGVLARILTTTAILLGVASASTAEVDERLGVHEYSQKLYALLDEDRFHDAVELYRRYHGSELPEAETHVLEVWREQETDSLGRSLLTRIALLWSDGKTSAAIRLCERECDLTSMSPSDLVARLERELRPHLDSKQPFLELLADEDGREEALREVPQLALDPTRRDLVLDRLDDLHGASPTDLRVAWALFQALVISRRYDDVLELSLDLETDCRDVSSDVCEPADGLFLEVMMVDSRIRLEKQRIGDTVTPKQRFEEIEPLLLQRIDLAEEFPANYEVPRQFSTGLRIERNHPLPVATYLYAQELLEAGWTQPALVLLEDWHRDCPERHQPLCQELWEQRTVPALGERRLRLEVMPRDDDFDFEAWRGAQPSERGKMAEALVRSRVLQWKSEAEVVHLLGEPDLTLRDQAGLPEAMLYCWEQGDSGLFDSCPRIIRKGSGEPGRPAPECLELGLDAQGAVEQVDVNCR